MDDDKAPLVPIGVIVHQMNHPLLVDQDRPQVLGASFDVTTQEGQQKLSRALRAKDISLDVAAGMVFRVSDMVVYIGTFPLVDTGEMQRMAAVRLISPDGRTLGWNSDIASQQFRDAIISVKGMPPYNPPVSVRVIRMPSKNHPGGSWYSFELAGVTKEDDNGATS